MRRFIESILIALALLAPATAFAATPTTGRHYGFPRSTSESADCSASTQPYLTLCHETADDTLWFCETSPTCAAAGWVAVGGGAAVPADSVSAASMASSDFGDFTCVSGTNTCTLDVAAATSPQFRVSWAVPVTTDDIYFKVSGGAITLTELACAATGSTTPVALVITADECDGNATTCVASGGTVTLSALVTNTADATFTDAAVDDNDWVRLDITSLTTTPDWAHCRLEFTQP